MKLRLVVLALATAVTCSVVTQLGTNPRAAVVQPTASPQDPIPPVTSCTKRIVSKACSSCSELGVIDKECKDGRDFRECSSTSQTCNNGALCNQHAGSDPC